MYAPAPAFPKLPPTLHATPPVADGRFFATMAGKHSRGFHGVCHALAPGALVLFCLCLSLPHVFADASNAIADRDAQRALQRARKVAFHSGNTGTTFSEVSLVVLAGPVGVFIRRAVDVNKGVRVTFGGIVANDRGKPLDAVHVVGKDFLWCVLPVGAAMFHPLHVVPALVLLAIVSYAFAQHAVKTRSKRAPYPTPHVTDSAPAPMGAVSRVGASRPYLTTYRASMTIATSVAILAVDFAAFPRRLGKTHAHGVGLMDLGAGSFLFANALVSRRRGGRAEKDFFANQGATRAARRLAKRVAPLLALALARAVSVTSTDYHVPVGEYGKRWNFFATLAAVLVLVDVAPVPPGTSAAFGFAVLLAHQWALSSKRMWSILAGASYLTEFRKEVGGGEGNASPWAHETLGHWVLADPRGDSFVSQNKEGIFSLPGYVGLFFLGVGIGVWMETSLVNAGRDARKAVNAELESLVQKATRAREMALAAAQQAKDFPSGGEFRARASLKHKDATAAEAQAVTATKRHRSRQAVERFDNENLISVVTTAPGGRADPHETAEGGWVWAWRWLAKLVGVCAFFWAAALACHVLVEPVSRRSANGAYCLWIVGFNMQTLVLIVAGSLVFPGSLPSPKLCQAVNRNLLPIFLFANVLTGAVNFLYENLFEKSDQVAYVAVTIYALAVCAFAIATGADELAMENRRVGRKAE